MLGGRCIAGKVVDPQNSVLSKGQWIRLVSPYASETGKAIPTEWIAQHTPSPDHIPVIEVAITEHCPTPEQPENWIVDLSTVPRLLKILNTSHLPVFADRFGPWYDNATLETIDPNGPWKHSLNLSLCPYGAWVFSKMNMRGKRQIKMSSNDSRGVTHWSNVKDLNFQERHAIRRKIASSPDGRYRLEPEFYTVFSLTETLPATNRQYKIAATIFA